MRLASAADKLPVLALATDGLPWPAALQWEQIKPVGFSPTARYGHAAVSMDSMQGMHFIFGGYGSNGTWTASGMMEVYMMDGPAQVHLSVSALAMCPSVADRLRRSAGLG